MLNNPEWVNTSVRQIIAALGIFLAALNLVEPAIWDQIAPALVSITLIVYDIIRTRDMEEENKALKTSNALWQISASGKADMNTATDLDEAMNA